MIHGQSAVLIAAACACLTAAVHERFGATRKFVSAALEFVCAADGGGEAELAVITRRQFALANLEDGGMK